MEEFSFAVLLFGSIGFAFFFVWRWLDARSRASTARRIQAIEDFENAVREDERRRTEFRLAHRTPNAPAASHPMNPPQPNAPRKMPRPVLDDRVPWE